MYHKLMTFIIAITLCMIARGITVRRCPKNEVLKFSTPRDQPACGNRRGIFGKWTFGNRCVCAHQWLVRNEAGECIPIWTCPEVCLPNQEFQRCTGKNQQWLTSGHFTADEILKLCKPICSCKNDYAWSAERRECVWAPLQGVFIGSKG